MRKTPSSRRRVAPPTVLSTTVRSADPDARVAFPSGVVMAMGDLRGSGKLCPRSGRSGGSSKQAASEDNRHKNNTALSAARITSGSVPRYRPDHYSQPHRDQHERTNQSPGDVYMLQHG